MSAATRAPRVAILGARGIGQVHARIFRELGAEVCAILGSTESSARATSAELVRTLGIEPKPFFQLDHLLVEQLDAVSICTPPHLHFAHLRTILDRDLPIFCEKPLFWDKSDSFAAVWEKLDVLEGTPGLRLIVNTSNAAFIDAARPRLPPAAEIDRFSFRFCTNGPYRGPSIAVDLMPHGYSLLLRLLGRQPLSSFEAQAEEQRYRCRFSYGRCRVDFDFCQGEGTPELSFRVNDHELRRVQQGRGATFQVHLHDMRAGDELRVEDPFATYIGKFLRCIHDTAAPWADMRSEATANMRLMAEALLRPGADLAGRT